MTDETNFHLPTRGLVIHAGKSHTDDIVTAALVLGAFPALEFPVYRRNPTTEELSDPCVWVADVGGRYEPSLSNFDHHTLSRVPEDAECAYTLISKYLNIYSHMSRYYKWYDQWKIIDHLGPYYWAGTKGIDWEELQGLLSPVAELLHDEFEEISGDKEMPEALKVRLRAFGIKLIKEAVEFQQFCEKQPSDAITELKGVKVYKPLGDSNELQTYALKWATDGCGAIGGILVVPDDRGPGLTLLRINNDPRVDFSGLDGHADVEFAHRGGFILKTKIKGEFHHLIEAAIK